MQLVNVAGDQRDPDHGVSDGTRGFLLALTRKAVEDRKINRDERDELLNVVRL